MVTDNGGNIWVIDREAWVNTPLLLVPTDFMVDHNPNTAWFEFSISDIGVNETAFDHLVMDRQGRLWMAGVAPSDISFIAYDFNGTPFNKNDDQSYVFTNPLGDLFNNNIEDLVIDQDNRLWIVTGGGAYYLDIPEQLSTVSEFDFGYIYDIEKKNAFFSSLDAFLLPSSHEGMSLTLLEALACQTPIISTPQAVTFDHNNTIILANRETDEIAEKIIELHQNEKSLDMIREKSLTIAQKYSWKETTKLTQKVYEEVC